MNNTTALKYSLTKHAIDRASIRFGVETDGIDVWANDVMKTARYVSSQGGGRLLYESIDGDIQLVVSDTTNVIITVHSTLRLDFLRPTLEREVRKIKRESIRQVRMLERRVADAYSELAERMSNFANARNPHTRLLIEGRIGETEASINALKRNIERMEDETRAKIKAIGVISE